MVSMIKRNAAVNADGFGVGWYNLDVDPEPCVFTSIAPAEHNANLARLSKKIQSHLIFGHVRAASPGSPVNDSNCHPFQFGRYIWMHNGCIANWSVIKRPLTALLSSCSFAMIGGTTDSEVAGALFVDQLPNHDPYSEHTPAEIEEAMKRTIQIITQMVHSMYIPGTGQSCVSSLNFAVSDGNTVVATRFRDSPVEEPPSLYYCSVTSMEMVAEEMEIGHDPTLPPKGVIIASEPLTYQSQNWTLVPKNQLIVVTNLTDIAIRPIITTSEMVTSKWIQELELRNNCHLPLSCNEISAYFTTPCCSCAASAPCPEHVNDLTAGSALLNKSASLSAPASPPIARRYSSDTKSAMILESPVMAGALRALLASATPAQLREILESNLLPCSTPAGNGSTSNLRKSLSMSGGLSPTASLDYDSVAQSLSPGALCGSPSSSTLSPLSSSKNLSMTSSEAYPFMHRGETPAVLQSSKTDFRSQFSQSNPELPVTPTKFSS